LDRARSYLRARAAALDVPADLRFDAMQSALEGKTPVFVLADEWEQIESGIAFCVRNALRPVLVGGRDAPSCLEILQRHRVPVIVSATHRLPGFRDDGYDEPFRLPAVLEQAGIRWCLAGGDGFYNDRNLPYQAATAVAYGLPRDAAIKALTDGAAAILGVADRFGSLVVGKSATLFVTDGDPLEVTSRVELAFLDGRRIELHNKQLELGAKYREKYRQLGIWPETEQAK
jgi:imidazolonepropionase-like amidohydrolase